ncbi:hypothetical protein [Streptosporangium sp. NPDC087985]|uniref:hypothetical protein n=1 Tax=Streptosporangium sp. NPDC087985 TaxID=3366196 RepID=UPI00380D1B84
MNSPWPTTIAEAEAVQERLRPLVDLTDSGPDVLRLTPHYRLPEPIRQADHLSRT